MIKSLEYIYKQNYKVLLKRASVILGDAKKAEDVIHDVFLRLLNHPEKLNAVSDMKAYLIQSVTNHALNAWKSSQKLVLVDDLPENSESVDFENVSNEHLDLQSLKRRLQHCLSNLSPRQRLIFKLSRYEGLDHDEIATYLNISKNTVKNQLVTSLAYLRLHLH